jgi:ubiquinone/menaquinone biosynthesis C-methylase UbiE
MSEHERLSRVWEGVAHQWAAWAREPGHDSYWRFHREAFFSLLPTPGRLTVDIGCGEGRVARDLKALGHNVMAFDVSPTLVQYAREADPAMTVQVADAAQLPIHDEVADLAIAFMSLQDVDDMPGAIGEIGRVLEPSGAACIALVHPINSSGTFESEHPDAPFVIKGSYLEPHVYQDQLERNGLAMTFTSRHWSLEAYAQAMERAGLVIEALREVPVDASSVPERPSRQRWRRLPLFLDLRARKR